MSYTHTFRCSKCGTLVNLPPTSAKIVDATVPTPAFVLRVYKLRDGDKGDPRIMTPLAGVDLERGTCSVKCARELATDVLAAIFDDAAKVAGDRKAVAVPYDYAFLITHTPGAPPTT